MTKGQVAEASVEYRTVGEGVPVGYKQTEVGVIPEDWEIKFGEELTTLIGKGASPRWQGFGYTNSGMLFVTSENVRDGYLDISEPKYLPLAFHEKIKRSKLRKGDILINLVGASIGRSCRIEKDLGEANINQAVSVFRVAEKYNSKYIACYFSSPICVDRILGMQVDAARPNISLGDLRRFLIPLPNEQEQTAIANALSDVDALINGLEKLITKKQAIKTATMQQLLTGRTRLPQFALREDGTPKGYKPSELGEVPEDWEVKTVGELSTVDPENLGSNTPRDYEFDYISLEQIDRGVLFGTTKCMFAGAPSRARRILKRGDVVVSTVRPNLMSHYHVHSDVENLICSTGFSVVRANSARMVPEFLYQHLFSFVINRQIETLISGSNYPAINSADVKRLKIMIGSVEEQTAIATILSDMDEEIQALQQRLSKTRQIKQGMMQELLTGRTRLV